MVEDQNFAGTIRIREDQFHCGICDEPLGPVEENWKHHAQLVEEPTTEMGVHWIHSREDFVFRRFLCPGCGTQLETETCPADDEVLGWYQPPRD